MSRWGPAEWPSREPLSEIREWPIEPTPAQLCRTSIYTLADWQDAYDMLHWRGDWPEIAKWATKNHVHPRSLLGFAAALTPPPALTIEDLDRIARYGDLVGRRVAICVWIALGLLVAAAMAGGLAIWWP